MTKRTILLMSALTWLGVFLLYLLWEFGLEEWIAPILIPGHGIESLVERWEHVATAMALVALALLGPTLLSLKISRRRGMAQEALEKSERRFKDFAETAADWFWETDCDHRFTYLSQRFHEITGIPTDQLRGMTATEIVPGRIVEEDKFEW